MPGCNCKARQAVGINIAVVDEGRCCWGGDARMQGSRKKLQVNPEIEREPRRQTQHARATGAEWKDAEVLQRASWGLRYLNWHTKLPVQAGTGLDSTVYMHSCTVPKLMRLPGDWSKCGSPQRPTWAGWMLCDVVDLLPAARLQLFLRFRLDSAQVPPMTAASRRRDLRSVQADGTRCPNFSNIGNGM